MKHFHALLKGLVLQSDRQPDWSASPHAHFRRPFHDCAWAVLVLALGLAAPARAQVVPTADAGGANISAGVMGSGYYFQYSERKVLGYAAFVDLDTRRRIGVEAEGRWLRYHEIAGESAATYLIGARYHYDIGRFKLYGKGLIGEGQFNFPYGLGHGNYFAVAPGAGVDYHLLTRFYWRVDAEYQIWPGFKYGTSSTYTLSSYGLSTGFRVRVF